MSADGVLTLILVMVILLLVIAVIAAAGVWIVALRWRRSRGGRRLRRRRSTPNEHAASTNITAPPSGKPMDGMSVGRPVLPNAEPVTHGDVPADDPRIVALDLEEPASVEAVFRNLEKVKPLLRGEVDESDRIGRTTPLAGRALRATGVFLWGFPAERGGLDVSYSDRLEAVTQVARIDVGMAWVVSWLTAHGDMTARLDDAAFAELYPSIDLPTVFSATPAARAVEVPDGKYRIETARWRLGSGGYHADRWLAGATVWDSSGEPVICEITGEQKFIGLWLPAEKVRQDDDWDPLGVRSSGSASYHLIEPVEVSRQFSFNMGADLRPYFFPFMGVMIGAAQHLIDLTLDALRSKHRKGAPLGAHDMTELTRAMASLDMLVFGLRGYAQYIDRIRSERASRSLTLGEAGWIGNVGMPVRDTVLRLRDLTTDIYGTGYVDASSEYGRVLRDIQVAVAHWWFRESDTQADRSERIQMMFKDPSVVPIWDSGWPVEIAEGR